MQQDKGWDDVLAGPSPDGGFLFFFLDRGPSKLRKLNTHNFNRGVDGDKLQRSLSMPWSGSTSASPVTPTSARKENAWRSAFNPGSKLNTEPAVAHFFDKPTHSSPTVYDWLYNEDPKNKHMR